MPGPSNPPRGKAKRAALAKRKRQEQTKKGKKKGRGKKKQVQTSSPNFSDDIEDEEDTRKKARRERGDDENENDENEEEEQELYSNDKIILACLCKGTRIGAAYYDPVKMIIFLLEDTIEGKHFDLLSLLLEQTSPDISLTSSRAEERAIEILQEHSELNGGTFQIRPHKEFHPIRGRDRLFALRLFSELPEIPSYLTNPTNAGLEPALPQRGLGIGSDMSDNAAMAIGSQSELRNRWVDPSMRKWTTSVRINSFAAIEHAPLCISSAGVLLDELARLRATTDADNEGITGLEVRGIETLALEQVMQINADACSSLSIFVEENHANMHSKRKKEGLSLFSVLNSTHTVLGRNLLRQWCIRPSRSMGVIQARHDAVEVLVHPSNISTAEGMHGHLKGMKNVPRILKQLQGGKAKLAEWQGLVKFTFHAALLKEAVSELIDAAHVEIFNKLLDVLDVTAFREVGNAVHEIIDWEESVHANSVCVRPNIDEELDNWKHIYDGIDSVLSRVAVQISTTIPTDYATSLNVVYFPQLGFLVCVPMRDEWRGEQGVQVLEGWTFQFSTETHAYFKNQQMRDMDHHIGDLHPSIIDREIEIIQSLLERIIVHAPTIALACDACAELDCLLSFAAATRSYGYVRPTMVEDNVIDIKEGRHPLQEMIVDHFVPNDVRMRGGEGLGVEQDRSEDDEDGVRAYSVLVLTGANACGKSVYLKQTALICYMAQIGCFVPAESAKLGIVDKMFTRIQTIESVVKVQSAFVIDLNQVSHALRNCTSQSLILLDEFGKGTLPADGAAIFVATIKYLLSLGKDCPKVIATTHFHEVFQDKVLDQTLPIGYLYMRVIVNGEELPNEDEYEDEDDGNGQSARKLLPGEAITYLYKVTPGVCLNSYAIQCARMFGLPAPIVRRAQYVLKLINSGNIQRLVDEHLTDEQISELEEQEAMLKRFLAWDLHALKEDAEAGTLTVLDLKHKLAEVMGVEWNAETGEIRKNGVIVEVEPES